MLNMLASWGTTLCQWNELFASTEEVSGFSKQSTLIQIHSLFDVWEARQTLLCSCTGSWRQFPPKDLGWKHQKSEKSEPLPRDQRGSDRVAVWPETLTRYMHEDRKNAWRAKYGKAVKGLQNGPKLGTVFLFGKDIVFWTETYVWGKRKGMKGKVW